MRETMNDIIDALRGMTNAGTADYTIAGRDYWTDSQLTDVLDRNRVDIFEQVLSSVSQTATDGTEEWKRYFTPAKWLETTDGGTAIFFLQLAGGSVVPLAEYTPDYQRGIVEFTADRGGQTIYMTARSYDVYAAAADVWEQKAAQAASLIDFSTLNHSVKRGHISQAYQRNAAKYRALSNTGSSSAQAVRSDLR
jgi:hypothetical protein